MVFGMVAQILETVVSLLSFSIVAGYGLALLAGALLGYWVWRRRSRLRRRLARQATVKASLRAEGGRKRQALARRCQHGNMLELADIVTRQLETVRQALHPCLYQRATVAIERTVEELDFDRLYAIHGLLSRSRGRQTAPALETILQGKR
jgi:hypothetical protein